MTTHHRAPRHLLDGALINLRRLPRGGWAIILLVAAGLAVVGVIENVNIRAGKKYKPRPRS